MDPRLVLYAVSIFHNKPILVVNHEIVRVIKKCWYNERGSVQGRDLELVEIKDQKSHVLTQVRSRPDLGLTNLTVVLIVGGPGIDA